MWFKIFTVKRFLNLLRIFVSYLYSVVFGRNVHWGYPISASIELTTFCNLQCTECITGQNRLTREGGFITNDLFLTIINQLQQYIFQVNLYFQGEPMLHGQLYQFIRIVNSYNLKSVISTNGHFLTSENVQNLISTGLSEIIISVDGLTQDVYESYRKKGNLQTVLSGIERLIQAKKDLNSSYPKITIQFLVTRINEHQIPKLFKLFAKKSVKIQLKTIQLTNPEVHSEILPRNHKYSRYKQDFNKRVVMKKRLLNRCFRMWSSCVITNNGDVIPCCFDKQGDFVMGNFKDKMFPEIWKNSRYQKFRQQILNNRKHIKMCTNCI